jgi:hypothetical protein
MGWRVVVITSHDFYDRPEEILHRVRDALIERGMVGVRRRFKPEWGATSSGPERLDGCAAQRPIAAATSRSSYHPCGERTQTTQYPRPDPQPTMAAARGGLRGTDRSPRR